jgi:V/A-type H+-transporting ATPase subunit K
MIARSRLKKWWFACAFMAASAMPAIAFAAEGAAEDVAVAWQIPVGKAIAAGLAMGLSALGAGYAQAKIGAAGAGALAERPEVSIWIITLQALPEIIVLLGFVSAYLINQ